MGMVSEAPASADSMAYSLSDILAWVCKGGEGGQRLRFCTGYFESKNRDWWTATERRPKLGRLTCQRDQRECFFSAVPATLSCPKSPKAPQQQSSETNGRQTADRPASCAPPRSGGSSPHAGSSDTFLPAVIPEDTTILVVSTTLASALCLVCSRTSCLAAQSQVVSSFLPPSETSAKLPPTARARKEPSALEIPTGQGRASL